MQCALTNEVFKTPAPFVTCSYEVTHENVFLQQYTCGWLRIQRKALKLKQFKTV